MPGTCPGLVHSPTGARPGGETPKAVRLFVGVESRNTLTARQAPGEATLHLNGKGGVRTITTPKEKQDLRGGRQTCLKVESGAEKRPLDSGWIQGIFLVALALDWARILER